MPRSRIPLLAALLLVFTARPDHDLAQAGEVACISGAVTAELSSDPGFEGLYKYTVTFSWSTSYGLSHADVFFALSNLECRCHPGIVLFPDPAGTAEGETPEGGSCTAVFSGEYACMGDPTIPEGMGPAIKFEHPDDPECEPGKSGSGILCFYSPFPPSPYTVNPEGLGVKAGTTTCLGELVGTPPLGDCSVPTAPATWGTLKSVFGRGGS